VSIIHWLKSAWYFPGEKILEKGPLQIGVEWFDDEGKEHSDKEYSGVYLTRSNRTGWYSIYDKNRDLNAKLNDSHIKIISWRNMATGEKGYHKTTDRGRNVLENNAMEAN